MWPFQWLAQLTLGIVGVKQQSPSYSSQQLQQQRFSYWPAPLISYLLRLYSINTEGLQDAYSQIIFNISPCLLQGAFFTVLFMFLNMLRRQGSLLLLPDMKCSLQITDLVSYTLHCWLSLYPIIHPLDNCKIATSLYPHILLFSILILSSGKYLEYSNTAILYRELFHWK